MEASTQAAPSTSTSVSGRKDKDGVEKSIELWPLKKKLKHLMATKENADAARDNYNAAIKAVAEETGLMAVVVKKLVKARADDKVFDEKRKADQLSMVLDEVGGIDDAGPEPEFSDSLKTGKANATSKKNGKAAKNGDVAQPPIGAGAPPAQDPLEGTDLAATGAGTEGTTFSKYLDEKQAGAPH